MRLSSPCKGEVVNQGNERENLWSVFWFFVLHSWLYGANLLCTSGWLSARSGGRKNSSARNCRAADAILCYTAMQRQKTVSAHFTSEHILPFAFAERYRSTGTRGVAGDSGCCAPGGPSSECQVEQQLLRWQTQTWGSSPFKRQGTRICPPSNTISIICSVINCGRHSVSAACHILKQALLDTAVLRSIVGF